MRYLFTLLLILTACARPDPAQRATSPRPFLTAPLGITPSGTLLASYAVTVPAGPGVTTPEPPALTGGLFIGGHMPNLPGAAP